MNSLKKVSVLGLHMFLLVVIAFTIIYHPVAAAPLQTLEFSVIGGGGGTITGGGYTLEATIGQPVTGIASANLCSGFWCGVLDGLASLLYLPIILR